MRPAEVDLDGSIRRLRSMARRLSPRDGDDLVQEALARALAHDVSCDAVPWLRTVIRNLAIDRARRARELSWGDAGQLEAVAGEMTPGAEEVVLRTERAEAIRQALSLLPPRQREALLAVGQGETAGDLAARMQISPGATWTLISRARARLRAELHKLGAAPAAFFGRFQRWFEPAFLGTIAVGMAVTLVVPAPAEVGEDRAPIRSAAVAPSEAPMTDAAPAEPRPPQPAMALAPAPIPDDEVALPEPVVETVVDYGGTVCTPEEAGEAWLDLGARFERNDEREDDSFSRRLVELLPEDVRQAQTEEGC